MAKKKVEDIRPGERIVIEIEVQSLEIGRDVVTFRLAGGVTQVAPRESKLEFLDSLPTPSPIVASLPKPVM